MKLWKISQDENEGYDTYDSAIVAAETEEDARKTHPDGRWGTEDERRKAPWFRGPWCKAPEAVKVELIGEAAPHIRPGVVLASFNAG